MSLAEEGKLRAPKGKFRVVGVDTFAGPFEDYLIGDFDTADAARDAADEKADDMNPCYVYDDEGQLVFNAGRP